MKIRLRTAVWWSSAFLVSGAPLASVCHAQSEELNGSVPTLDTVKVQGHTVHSGLPPGSTVTTLEELQSRSITDWTDFSRRAEPAINFNQSNKSINIRGMDADRVVTRMDGIRLPWLTDGARGVQGGLDSVSFGSLAAVEVTRGTGANRSGALTGAVELRTLAPDDLLASDQDFGAMLNSGYDSAEHGWRINATLAGRLHTNTRWLLHVGTRRGDEVRNYGGIGGYGDDRTKTNPLDYRQNNVLLKLDHDLNAEHRLEFSGERFRYSADIDNRRAQGPGTNFAIGQNSTQDNIDRDRILLGYRFQAATERAGLDQGHLKLYWQRLRLESQQNGWRTPDARGGIIPGDPFNYRYPYGAYERDNSTQESGFGASTEWSGYLNAGSTRHRWTVGGDGYISRTRQDSSGYDNCPAPIPGLPAFFGPRACDLLHTNQSDMPRVEGEVWSMWAQNEISSVDGRYALTPAVRFDAYRYSPDHGGSYQDNPNAGITTWSSNSGQRVSPSLLARYEPTNTISLYASYAYGFKAPNPSQLYLDYGAPGTYLSVGNPDLKPETSHGWELGIEAGDSQLNGRLSVFNNRYDDFLDSDYAVSPTDPNWNPAWDDLYPMGVTTTINRSRVRIYGVEASGRWQITPQWYGRAGFAWTRGKDLDANTPLNSIAPLKTSIALGYNATSWGAEAMLTAAASRSRVENSSDFKAPGYGVTDLSAWWTPASVEGLRLQAGIYNVFDKKYWQALNVAQGGRDVAPVDYYTEAGRSIRLAISYQY